MLLTGNGRKQRADIPNVTPKPGFKTVENKIEVVFPFHKQTRMGSNSLLAIVLTAHS